MNIQAKQFVARCDFNHNNQDYTAGEVIPESFTLGRLIALGFAVEANPRNTANSPTTTNTETKEGGNGPHN